MDSLGKVSLSAFIATAFGVEVPEENLPAFSSVRKLAEYLEENKVTMGSEKMDWGKILHEKVHLKLPRTWFTFSLFKNISGMLLRMFLRVRSRGVENLPGSPCIITPNHQSFLDSFLVVSLLKKQIMKNTYFYAKEKHFKNRLLRFIANRNNIIIMDINKNLKGSIQKMAEALRRGKNLMIFPEGTRTDTGKLGNFKQTFAILSRELNVPVVPVAIKGAYEVMPTGARFPRLFRKVQVEFLHPVYPDHGDYETLRKDVYQKLAMAMGQHDGNG
jgi:long-chain acyl-CoA synthetase